MTYRGKYPTRIKEVYSINGRKVLKTNDGRSFFCEPKTYDCKIPECGMDINAIEESGIYVLTPRN